MLIIRINDKKVQVPAIKDVTVEQFLKLIEIEDFNIIDYLSIVLNVKYKVAKDFRINNIALLSAQLFGAIPDYKVLKPKGQIFLNKRRYKLSADYTLGQRFEIEENGKGLDPMELILFILAVNADSEKYLDLIPLIKQSKAAEILPDAFFLLENFSNGSKKGPNILTRLRNLIRIKS